MASKLFFLFTPFALLILFFASRSHSLSSSVSPSPSPSSPTSPSNICKLTPDPNYCKSVLPHFHGNVYDYGRFSLRKSLSKSKRFVRAIDRYLKKYHAHLTMAAVGALEDCRLLAGFTVDNLLTSLVTVNGKNATLPILTAEDVQTLLSAAITNEQTCFDGVNATTPVWSVPNGVTVPLLTDAKLYSVSLALFTKGWVPKKKKRVGFSWIDSVKSTRKPVRVFRNGALPLKMTGRTRAIFEAASRRRLDDRGVVNVSDMVVVSKDGTGNFTTVGEAVTAVPKNSDGSKGYFLIYVKAGVYEEYVSIVKNKKYLMMIGDGINRTVITGNRSVVDGWTTFNSATFAVVAPNFVAVNITFRNTAGPEKHQAVAVRSGSDLSIFYSCSFEAYQDTLYTHSLRQFYRDCDIYGTVDFIFGNAAVVIQNCNIYPRRPMNGQFNAITAQGRVDPNQNTGTTIHNCTIKPADDLVKSNYSVKTYLGRPWKEYSRTAYMQTYMDRFIEPEGWRFWNGNFALDTLYYTEYNNTGPGSNISNRVKWPGYHVMNATDAANFTVSGLLLGDDWIAPTGVPYTSGLIV